MSDAPAWTSVVDAAEAVGVPLAAAEVSRVERYLALLAAENGKQNLTTVTDRGAVLVDHVADALALAPVAARHGRPLVPGAECVDLGSGGGIPGLLLACAFPGTRWTLVESEGKKADWLARVAAAMELGGVTVFPHRGRELRLRRPELAERVDVVTARAVADLGRIAREVRGLPGPGGIVLCPKGRGLDDRERSVGEREARKSRLEPVAEVPLGVPGRDRVCVVYGAVSRESSRSSENPESPNPTAAR